MLVAAAISNGDSDRREALEELANQLVVNATDASTQVDSAVLLWASALRPSSYEITMLEGGRLMLQARVPPEIELEHQAQQAEFTLASEAYRLLNTYAIPEDRRSSDVTHLDEDLRVARTISDNPPPQLGRSAGDALVVVAAAALIAHGDGRHLLSDDDIAWAGGYVIDAVSPGAGNEEYAGFSIRQPLTVQRRHRFPACSYLRSASCIPPRDSVPNPWSKSPRRLSDAQLARLTRFGVCSVSRSGPSGSRRVTTCSTAVAGTRLP